MGRHSEPKKPRGLHRSERRPVDWRGLAVSTTAGLRAVVETQPRRRMTGAVVVAVVLPVLAFASVAAPKAGAAPADLRPPLENAAPPAAPSSPPVSRVAVEADPVLDANATFDAELDAALEAVERRGGHHGDSHSSGGRDNDGHDRGGHGKDRGHSSRGHDSDDGHCK